MGLEINFKNYNEQKYGEEKDFLKDQIINGSNADYFLALNHEAGFGKTIYAEEALIRAEAEGKNSIFCRQFIENCNESADRINKLAQKQIAIAIDCDNVVEYQDVICKYPIVIITHERYKVLSTDIEQLNIYKVGREILIIDEEIDMVKSVTFSAKDHSAFLGMISNFRSIYDLYQYVTSEIVDFISTNKKKIFYKPSNNYSKEIRKLKLLIKANIDNEFASLFDYTKNYFLEKVDELEMFLNTVSVADGKLLYNYDRNIRFWKLNNNILLDACADLNYIYKLSKEFKIVAQEKVFDHSNWTIKVINHNSCKTKKQKSRNFYSEVNTHIQSVIGDTDRMLVIGSKDEMTKVIINDRIYYIYFGNLVGKNNWMNYTKCYIIVNPQWRFPDYVLAYMYYSNACFESGDSWGASVDDGGVYRFRNEKIELIRQTAIATQIYQAAKRINRSNASEAEVFIINNDEEVLNMIRNELLNVKVDKQSLDIKFEDSKKKKVYDDKREEDAYYTRFIEVVDGLEKGVYQKKWIREQIGLENRKTFSQKVLNKQKVIDYMDAANIIAKGQNIIVG